LNEKSERKIPRRIIGRLQKNAILSEIVMIIRKAEPIGLPFSDEMNGYGKTKNPFDKSTRRPALLVSNYYFPDYRWQSGCFYYLWGQWLNPGSSGINWRGIAAGIAFCADQRFGVVGREN
jgi:hypothetical protein